MRGVSSIELRIRDDRRKLQGYLKCPRDRRTGPYSMTTAGGSRYFFKFGIFSSSVTGIFSSLSGGMTDRAEQLHTITFFKSQKQYLVYVSTYNATGLS